MNNKYINMIRTLSFFSWMWIVLLFSILLLIPLKILELFRFYKIKSKYVQKVTSAWARHLVSTSGSKIHISGKENIPENLNYCVISNHQSNFDIPLIMAVFPENIGFISKDEMKRVPFLSVWMKALNCIFIKRQNIKQAIDGLKQAMKQIKNGNSMVLFPEGTRSRDGKPGKFYNAGIRLAIDEGIPILPVSIKNSFNMFEKNGRIIPTDVEIIIHKLQKKDSDQAPLTCSDIISTIKSKIN